MTSLVHALSLLPVALAALLAVTGCANRLFYHPTNTPYGSPADDGYAFRELTFKSGDGTVLHAWFVEAQGPARGSVIHLHGNAQNLSAHYAYVSWLPAEGYNLFVFDYRGYGKSEGHPNRKGIYQDVAAALKFFVELPECADRPKFALGQSLGAAYAIAAIGRERIKTLDGVVSDSAFASHRSVAKENLKRLPAGFLLSLATPVFVSSGYDPIDWVDQIAPTPIAFVHGTRDRVVPYEHAEELYDRASHPKYLWRIEGGSHTNALSVNRSVFVPRILLFFEQCAAEKEPPPL